MTNNKNIIGGTASATLNNVALVATDPQVSGGVFSITNLLGVDYGDVVISKCSAAVKVSNSATQGVITVTYTGGVVAANTDYSFYLMQVPNGGVLTGFNAKPIFIEVNTNGITSPTVTSVSTQIKNAVAAAQGLDVVTSGTTTAIFTASVINPSLTAPYPLVSTVYTTPNSNIILTQTTAGVEEFGNFQYMTDVFAVNSGSGIGTFAQNATLVGTPISGHTYSYVKIVTRNVFAKGNGNEVQTTEWDVFIDEGDAAYAQWVLNYNKEMANFNATNYIVNKIPSSSLVATTVDAATSTTTLAQVNNAIFGGLITSLTAAGVTMTLPTVAQMVTFLASLGITVKQGYSFYFDVDNTLGANTFTVAVDAGGTISATKQVSSGDTAVASLLVVTNGATTGYARFHIYFTSGVLASLTRLF